MLLLQCLKKRKWVMVMPKTSYNDDEFDALTRIKDIKKVTKRIK